MKDQAEGPASGVRGDWGSGPRTASPLRPSRGSGAGVSKTVVLRACHQGMGLRGNAKGARGNAPSLPGLLRSRPLAFQKPVDASEVLRCPPPCPRAWGDC